MGNQFTYYTGNLELIVTNNVEIFAFALYNSNLSQSDFILGPRMGDWEILQHNNGDSTYNLLFRYKPSGTYTVVPAGYFGTTTIPLKIFKSNSSQLNTSLSVDWSNNTANLGNINTIPIFSNPYTTEPVARSASNGGGDPHIIPYFNPLQKVYMLPTDEKIYNYFDNLDEEERLIINTKMWVLDSRFIKIVERAVKSKKYNLLKSQVIEHRQYSPFSPLDTSFARYISIIYKTVDIYETVILDTEKFREVEYTNDDDVDNILLKEKTIINNKILKLGESIKNDNDLIYPNEIKFGKRNSDMRKMFINTKKHGLIEIQFLVEYDRPNHRNNIELIFHDITKLTQSNCTGCLISLNGIKQVPSLMHINDIDDDNVDNVIKVKTVDEYANDRKNEKLRLQL